MTRSELERLQWKRLRAGLERVSHQNRFYTRKWTDAGVDVATLGEVQDLSELPLTTKEELLTDQVAFAPYGSNLTGPLESFVRMHQTSGTSGRRLRWLDNAESWDWLLSCWSQIFQMIGTRSTDRFFFPFSFGPFLGFWAAFEGAARESLFSLAGGGMTTLARLRAILENRITVVCTTPTYARRLAEVAHQEGMDLSSSTVRLLIVAGEPGANLPSVRRYMESAWGARVIDHWGMTEVGPLAIEPDSMPERLVMLENQCIAEFLDPATSQPVPEGEIGELVITNLGRWGSPLIRYRTGDMCRWRSEDMLEGLPFVSLEGGIVGRVDDMVWIKGNNIYPSSLESLVREQRQVEEFMIEVDDRQTPPTATIVIEPAAQVPVEDLRVALESAFQSRFLFRPNFRFVSPGTLARSDHKTERVVRLKDNAPSTF